MGRAAGWFVVGLAIGAVLHFVSFGLAMTYPSFILPLLILCGMVLSVIRWPAMVGVAAFLVWIWADEEVYVSPWVPIALGVAWGASRGVWILYRRLRDEGPTRPRRG